MTTEIQEQLNKHWADMLRHLGQGCPKFAVSDAIDCSIIINRSVDEEEAVYPTPFEDYTLKAPWSEYVWSVLDTVMARIGVDEEDPDDIEKEFWWDVFVTSMEGGISYWAEVRAYSPWKPHEPGAELVEDRDGFKALIREYGAPGAINLEINREVLQRGMSLLLSHKDPAMKAYLRQMSKAFEERDAGEIDADDADTIVQMGLFGEIRYG